MDRALDKWVGKTIQFSNPLSTSLYIFQIVLFREKFLQMEESIKKSRWPKKQTKKTKLGFQKFFLTLEFFQY